MTDSKSIFNKLGTLLENEGFMILCGEQVSKRDQNLVITDYRFCNENSNVRVTVKEKPIRLVKRGMPM